MNAELMIEIANLALSVANNAMNGGKPANVTTTTILLILQKGVEAYEEHTGQTLDPSLIQTEAAV